MSREEYLDALRKHLGKLPTDEKDSAMQYYIEYTEELVANGEDIEEKLGSPKDLANSILSEAAIRKMEEPEKGIKSRMDGVWLGILAIFALPIGLPLAIAAAVIVFAIIIVIFAVLLCLVLAAFVTGLGGVVGVFAAFTAWFSAPMTGMVATGAGIFLIGFGILIMLLVTKLWGAAFRLIGRLLRRITDRKRTDREVH